MLSDIFFGKKHISGLCNITSPVRNLLFEINPYGKNIGSALYELAHFSESPYAFFTDTEGEYYKYVNSDFEDKMLSEKDREEFINEMLGYAEISGKESKDSVFKKIIKQGTKLKAICPGLHGVMEKHKIESICVAIVSDGQDAFSVLGVVNPGKRTDIDEVLTEVADFFPIAIRNNKYISKTEKVASIDALTGLYNRLMFNYDFPRKKADLRNKYTVIYIDVNELHIFNHKFGHEAGDKMLFVISDTVSKLFLGNPMYRIGGDEFLILAKNMEWEDAKKRMSTAKEMISKEGYHISVGIAERKNGESLDDTLKNAEKIMYEEKALYYHKKTEGTEKKEFNSGIEHMETGVNELDKFLSVLGRRCSGVFYLDTKSDKAKRIIAPEFFREFEDSTHLFGKTFYNYVIGMVKSDYHRALLGLTLYSSWEKQRENREELHMSYEKTDGSKMLLTIYPVSETEAVWMFENV